MSNLLTEKSIIIDTETTGLTPGKDELLQFAIVDNTGKILFNEYIKPTKTTEWPEAQAINGISPEKVKKCKPLKKYKRKLSKIFKNATTIIGYNTKFDLQFIANDIDIYTESQIIIDLMPRFAKIYGEKRKDFPNEYKWQKLSTAAEYYDYNFTPHDALNDVLATLHIAKNLL